jgi:hypothetical protein
MTWGGIFQCLILCNMLGYYVCILCMHIKVEQLK